MSYWHLPTLLDHLHQNVEQELASARQTLAHPTEKGDASEAVWIDLFNRYLPRRYEARKAHVVDSKGGFSDQMDVVIHDRQYSPLVFTFKDSFVVPAESIYAVFEAKQDLTADHIRYAQQKIASVRRLHRTSMPVPTVDGLRPAKAPSAILGGVLTLHCNWSPPMGDTLLGHLKANMGEGRLDLGCVADAGLFTFNMRAGSYEAGEVSRAATRFLFELIARLQELATVPMIDMRAYAAQIP